MFSIEELRRDTTSMRYNGLNNFHVGVLDDARAVVDGPDTLLIERRFPREKLLLAKQTASLAADGRRLIYQYR
ncbi:hypothetical protein [Hymenobacter jeollabukensis]|uniref:Uncharacterized protein n=1 Tax=Hymenobacter jeollabukensis TaxID=2025313 RepID=A0A5R8WMI5_9BACT|nr:hypothetical protein [Hymenobacter jeollabukensis]TLM90107.1 hypothetical protein FDY95_19010 [Hymenobacter jeollabukensis]